MIGNAVNGALIALSAAILCRYCRDTLHLVRQANCAIACASRSSWADQHSSGDHLLTSAPGRSRTDTGDPFRGPASSLGLRGLGNNTPERLSDSRAAELIQNVSPGGSFSIFTWTPNAKRNHFDYVRRLLLTERYRATSMRRDRPQASLQPGSVEDRVQHARGDPASERVLLTRVITA